MNILIVADSFLDGGLETHILTLYNELKKSNNFCFIFGKYNNELLSSKEKIYSNFHFSHDATIKDFCDDVNYIVDIIKKERIDVINVHPFYAIFSVIFAANITNTPVAYTYHGRASTSFTSGINDTILFEYAFESTIRKVFAVSQKGVDTFNTLFSNNVEVLLNPIDINKFSQTEIKKAGKWALVSRLDENKAKAINKLFNILPQLNINSIDVYGDGKEYDSLLKKCQGLNVNFKGYSKNINEQLKNNYTGVIGVGRSALEGLVMNYPVLMLGDNRICGIIDDKMYEELKNYNFAKYSVSDVDLDLLNKQLDEINKGKLDAYLFRKKVIKDFGSLKISKQYEKALKNISLISQNNVIELYDKIEKLIDFGDGSQNIFNSQNVFYLLKNYIEYYTKNFYLKNMFVLQNKNYIMYDKLIREMENIRKDINYSQNRINELNDLIKKIGISNKIKNGLRKVINKWKKLK